MSAFRIGIDLGGTKIEGILLEGHGQECARKRVPTPSHDYDGTIEAVTSLVASLEESSGCRASVGIGMPGAISRKSSRVKNANSVWLNGRPLKEDLQAALGRPVRLANDANCFALSEGKDGAGQGLQTVFGVILGTGVGGGIYCSNGLHAGANDIAGEWGHSPLPWPSAESEWPGPACYCGKTGCIETFLSGPGMSNDHFRATGISLSSQEISLGAEAGQRDCRDTIERYAVRLGKSLATVVNLIDPDVIVLGGGLSQIRSLYETVPPILAEFAFSDYLETKLVPPCHGDSSGVRGAAWLWPGYST